MTRLQRLRHCDMNTSGHMTALSVAIGQLEDTPILFPVRGLPYSYNRVLPTLVFKQYNADMRKSSIDLNDKPHMAN